MLKNDTSWFSRWDIPVALVLLTRLPIPRLPDQAFARQASAVWAFPLAGLVTGVLALAIGWLSTVAGLPALACASLIVAVLILTTGAMHEDGLADMFDGLWGGYTPERRLEIMKDSHIGTYGVLALGLSQLLRIAGIAALIGSGALAGILAACVFSRALMPVLMMALPNARSSGLSRSVGRPAATPVWVGLGLASGISLLLLGLSAVIPILCTCTAALFVALIAKSKIGGQTGDILGATQQIGEIIFLLTLTAVL